MKKIKYGVMCTLVLLGISLHGQQVSAAALIEGSESDKEGTDVTVDITSSLDAYVQTEGATARILVLPEDTSVYIQDTIDEVMQDVSIAVSEGSQRDVEEVVKYPQFIGQAISNVDTSINIRATAQEDGERLGKLPAGATGRIVERGPEWTKIESGDVVGYVKNEYLLTGDEAGTYAEDHLDKIATVTTQTLKVRETQDINSACVSMIPEGDSYPVKEEYEDWAQVKVGEGLEGCVSKEYVNISFVLDVAISREEEEAIARREAEEAAAAAAAKAAAGRQDICRYAVQFVGNPYVWGGASLTNGADCSGFTMRVYAKFGYSLPHSAASQSNYGKAVSISNLKPGDLLFYKGSNGSISHVTMYIGNGQVVHASSAKTGIKISSVGYRTPCCARRISSY